jgi:NAD(P)-dependent dehydrogenase (short-subunit alcohol dehydrogenase family)
MTGTALVTGGSRGIGLAIARELQAEGWNVALTSRCSSKASEVARSISTNTLGFAYEAKDQHSAVALVREVTSAFGSITALVNVAGFNYNSLLLRLNEDHVHEVIQSNLLGPLWM